MKIGDIFQQKFNQSYNVVARFEDQDRLQQDIAEFILTDNLAVQIIAFLEDLLENKNKQKQGDLGKQDIPIIWITGAFGSGKTYLTKILTALLENRIISPDKNLRAVDLFRQTILSNRSVPHIKEIDQLLSRITASSNWDVNYLEIDRLFLGPADNKMPFEQVILGSLQDKYGDSRKDEPPWLFGREENTDILNEITNILMKNVSLDSKRTNLVFVLDHIDQLIQSGIVSVQGLRNIFENIGNSLKISTWLILISQTYQSDYDNNAFTLKTSVEQESTNIKFNLSNEYTDRIVRGYISRKNHSGEAALKEIFHRFKGTITTMASLTPESIVVTEEEFIENYPFLPYEIGLIRDVLGKLTDLDYLNTTRSLLAMTQSVLSNSENEPLGALVEFDRFFDEASRLMKEDIQENIGVQLIEATDKKIRYTPVAPSRILKILWLICQIDWLPKTPDVIAKLLANDIATDIHTLRTDVELTLEQLMSEQLVIIDDGNYYYSFPSKYLSKRSTDVDAFVPRAEAVQIDSEEFARLRYIVENEYPTPIAKAFYILRGMDDWKAQIPQLANILGLVLEHLAILTTCEYLAGDQKDPEINNYLSRAFQKPLSHGSWAGLIRKLVNYLQNQPPPHYVEEFYTIYTSDNKDEKAAMVSGLIDDLIPLRNYLLKKSGETLPDFYKYKEFKGKLLRLLQSLAFLAKNPLLSVKSTQIEDGIKTHSCYRFNGSHEIAEYIRIECDLDLHKNKLVMLNLSSGELLYLYPFYLIVDTSGSGSGPMAIARFEQIHNRGIKYAPIKGEKAIINEIAKLDLLEMLDNSYSLKIKERSGYLFFDDQGEELRFQPGEIIGNKYKVIKHLQSGGMSDIYEVRSIENKQDYALKLLPFQLLRDRNSVRRFHQEIDFLKSIDHPNIIRLIEAGKEITDHYIVMELADGWKKDNITAIDVGQLTLPLDIATVISIAKQVCEALDYIHNLNPKRIIHRDIKPSNLLLFNGGIVKISDFGISRAAQSVTLTMTGMGIGTPEYMSPEQARGEKDITPSSDIYSLGVVLHELLTGKNPYRRSTPMASVFSHLQKQDFFQKPFDERVPSEIQFIIRRCLKLDIEERYKSVRDLYMNILSIEKNFVTSQD
jgi:hypothetical protein